MATTKQINELNAAQSVAPTDKLPLAKAAGGEAVAATVSQVAAAVAALNEEGALAELALATSVGKNLLAQRLTEKGVPTSARETLAQMADKVQGLTVTDAACELKGRVIYERGSEQVPSPYRPYTFKRLSTGDTLFLANDTLHYIPDGDYDNFSQFITGATSQADAVITENKLKSCFGLYLDKNEEYAAVATAFDTVNLYTVDKTAKTVTLYKTLTLTEVFCPNDIYNSYYDQGLGLCILPGGGFITYFQTYKNSSGSYRRQLVAVNTQTGDSVATGELNVSNYADYAKACMLTDTAVIAKSSNSYSYAWQTLYSITEDGAWQWGKTVPITMRDFFAPQWNGWFMFTTDNISYQKNWDKLNLYFHIYNEVGQQECYVRIPYFINENVSSSYANFIFLRCDTPKIFKAGDKYHIELAPWYPPIIYDPAAKTAVVDNQGLKHADTDPNGLGCFSYLFGNKKTNTYWGSIDMGYSGVATSAYICWYKITPDNKRTGIEYTTPDGEKNTYWRNYISKELLESGAMDLTATKVMLPGAEEDN